MYHAHICFFETGALQNNQTTLNVCTMPTLFARSRSFFIKETPSYQSGNGLHTETQTRSQSQHVVTSAEQTSSSSGVNIYMQ